MERNSTKRINTNTQNRTQIIRNENRAQNENNSINHQMNEFLNLI